MRLMVVCVMLVMACVIPEVRAVGCARVLKCTREGQFCKRWDGTTGWCRKIYDIKGYVGLSCEAMERDRFGYPDWGYYWGGQAGSIVKVGITV
jgi:hypothetical protein